MLSFSHLCVSLSQICTILVVQMIQPTSERSSPAFAIVLPRSSSSLTSHRKISSRFRIILIFNSLRREYMESRHEYRVLLRHLVTMALMFLLLAPAWGLSGAEWSDEDLVELSAGSAVKLLCSQDITAERYARALLARVHNYTCINSFASFDAKKVLSQAAAVDTRAAAGEDVGPLCGLLFAVKDNIDVSGYPTVGGTPGLEGNFPELSSPLIDRLQAANGIVIGKTRMHELALGDDSINPHYGPVLNPHNVTMHTGGSSGGTAALVAARGVPAGFCSDTGGSCRNPGSMTGTVGFRPTTGCYQAGAGIVPLSVTRDTVGIMARHVSDVILLDKIFSSCPRDSPSVTLPGMRIGYPKQWWAEVGWESEGVFEAALQGMVKAGVQLVEVDVGLLLDTFNAEIPDHYFYTYEAVRELARYMGHHKINVSLTDLISKIGTPSVHQLYFKMATHPLEGPPSPTDMHRIIATSLPKLSALWHSYFDVFQFDVMVVPTTPIPSRPINDVQPLSEINGRREVMFSVYGRTHMIDAPVGIPSISIPIGHTDYYHMPIGLQFHARSGADALLLAVGEALQPLFAPTDPPPPLPKCYGCFPKATPLLDFAITENGSGYEALLAQLHTVTFAQGSQFELDMMGECEIKKELAFPRGPPANASVLGPLLAKKRGFERRWEARAIEGCECEGEKSSTGDTLGSI